MRFEFFTIEKYGLVDSRTVRFPPDRGLVVLYGPNEAGKSTSLAAIADFLFGVPHTSPRGQVFGYDQIRLTAVIALADGTRLSLRRRKGKGRTLTDDSGQAVDEALLARCLGSTGRERFCSLFGLDHTSLRSGGERLLAADGDIGRLIVEAGGGLRTLVDVIDKLARDADALFAPTRAGHRAFYKGLDAYQIADRAAKEGLLTRDGYEEARRRQNDAQASLEALRRTQQETAQHILRLQRLVRVIPSIRELDRVDEELAAFADLSPLRDDFADAARDALQALEQARGALAEAEERHAALAAKVDALAPSEAVLAAETLIREIEENALHVRKARGDRANRETELADRKAKLDVVRRAVGLAADADLEAVFPPAEAIQRVQKLATKGLERRAKMAAFSEQITNEERTLADLSARQNERRAAGRSEPLGVTIMEFATLPALSGALETKEKQAESLGRDIAKRVGQLGFEDLGRFVAWSCPDAAIIQAEVDRRALIEAELARIAEKYAAEAMKRDTASGAIERLTLAKEIPTDAAITRARGDRNETWKAISDRYLSERGEEVAARAIEDRKADVDQHRRQIDLADSLVDRKSLEAERVAALDLAQRQKAEAIIALTGLDKQRRALDERRQSGVRAWEEAWPEASNRQSDLGRLKALVEERRLILDRHAALRALIEDIEQLRAEIAPRRSALEQAEAMLAPEANAASMSARASAASKAIKLHEDGYSDYRRDDEALRDVNLRRQSTQASLDALSSAQAEWRLTWASAISALRLEESAEPERANEVATQWATAAGLLDGVKLTRARLQRMNDDETDLREKIDAVAPTLDFMLPDDCLAGAAMLAERLDAARKIASERQVLAAQLKERAVERHAKTQSCEAALAKVLAVCAEAGCEREALDALARRSRERGAARGRRQAVAQTIIRSGDGLPIEALREQWAGRDLDVVEAELAQAEQDAVRLTAEIEAVLGELQDRTRELEKFSATGGINEAVAARERATAEIHDALERYLELALAKELLSAAMDRIRAQQQDPLILRAGALFSASTQGVFAGIETDVDEHGNPVVVGRRAAGEIVPVARMSDGARDQLFLAFRIASIEQYCKAAEPLPFIADDLLVHFDNDRGAAALGLLAELGATTQVLLFTHHRHVREDAEALALRGRATVVDLARV